MSQFMKKVSLKQETYTVCSAFTIHASFLQEWQTLLLETCLLRSWYIVVCHYEVSRLYKYLGHCRGTEGDGYTDELIFSAVNSDLPQHR